MAATSCVVDTSAWIEWLVGSALGQRLRPHFPVDGLAGVSLFSKTEAPRD
ncbi:hypothetical protein [Igneacidithiobacillus copahuensis]|nr:hypothetical protein [Igneacidithiobacillus copahuensis]